MILFAVAAVLAFIGVVFFIIDHLSDSIETKGWGMFFFIASASTCLLKYYLANPEPVNNFFRSIFSK